MALRPLFLGGTGRCGTTLLSRLISSHPALTTIPESRFLVDPGGIFDFVSGCESWTPFQAHERVVALRKVLKSVGESSWIGRIIGIVESKLPVFRRKFSTSYSGTMFTSFSPHFIHIVSQFMDELVAFE